MEVIAEMQDDDGRTLELWHGGLLTIDGDVESGFQLDGESGPALIAAVLEWMAREQVQ